MRLVFYCPLTARIGHHIREIIQFKAHSSYRKYNYFISSYFNHPTRKTAIFWHFHENMSWSAKMYRRLKVFLWMLVNLINPWKIKLLSHVSQLSPSEDVLLFFPFLSFDPKDLEGESSPFSFRGLKVFHFSHYFSNPMFLSHWIKNLEHKILVGEGMLCENPLFQFLVGAQPFYLLPFVLRRRYRDFVPLSLRKPKCLACGTKSKISRALHREFYQIFQSDYLHPLRAEIFDQKEFLQDVIECLIFDFDELSDYQPRNSWEKLVYRVKRKIGNDRKRFFSFDMVQKYNEYQMFVSPEEESGAPSINFIEGMACGCAYLGRPEFYTVFGLKPGVHFIPYDGSLRGLRTQIQYYQSRLDQLEEIAKAGQEFIMEYCDEKKVTDHFWEYLHSCLKNC